MDSPASTSSSISLSGYQSILSKWFRGHRSPRSPFPSPSALFSTYGTGARGLDGGNLEPIPEIQVAIDEEAQPKKRSRLVRLWNALTKRGRAKGTYHSGEQTVEALAAGATLIRLLKFPAPIKVDYSLWLDKAHLAAQSLQPVPDAEAIKGYRSGFNDKLKDGIWFARFKADGDNQPWCLVFHPRHWKGHGTRSFDPANTTFPAIHGFRPAAISSLDVRSSEHRWPLKPTISHTCHFPICGSPQCLRCEPAYANTSRNYCKPSNGSCRCGSNPSCTRTYRSSWELKELEFLSNRMAIAVELTSLFGSQGVDWVYLTESDAVKEYQNREAQRRRREQQAISDKQKGTDRTTQRKIASQATRKAEQHKALREKDLHE